MKAGQTLRGMGTRAHMSLEQVRAEDTAHRKDGLDQELADCFMHCRSRPNYENRQEDTNI
jgi:hypothetical protein